MMIEPQMRYAIFETHSRISALRCRARWG